MNRLDGKVAFLSGAARGIGGATARLMAQAGAKVAIGDVLDERGRQTAKEIEAAAGWRDAEGFRHFPPTHYSGLRAESPPRGGWARAASRPRRAFCRWKTQRPRRSS